MNLSLRLAKLEQSYMKEETNPTFILKGVIPVNQELAQGRWVIGYKPAFGEICLQWFIEAGETQEHCIERAKQDMKEANISEPYCLLAIHNDD